MLSPALKSYHDLVLVVTHPGAAERQKNVTEQLGAENFEFVQSIDKTTVTKPQLIDEGIYDEVLARQRDRRHRKMTLGHICCAYGHRLAYERMIECGSERALIFEDDALRLPASEDEIRSALDNIPDDAELIYWGWYGGRFRPRLGFLQQAVYHTKYFFGSDNYNHTMIRNLYMKPHNKHFYVSSVNFLLHSYTITRQAAEKLVELNTPINLNSDHAAIYAILNGDIRGYVSRKQFFGQRSIDPSDPVESQTQKYY